MRIAAFSDDLARGTRAHRAQVADRVDAAVPILPVDFELAVSFQLKTGWSCLRGEHVGFSLPAWRSFEQHPCQSDDQEHDDGDDDAEHRSPPRRATSAAASAQTRAARVAVVVSVRPEGASSVDPHGVMNVFSRGAVVNRSLWVTS